MDQILKITVDCNDLDIALEKVKQLNAQLEKALELQSKLRENQEMHIVGQRSDVPEIELCNVSGFLGKRKVGELQGIREKFTFEKIPDIPEVLPTWGDVNGHEQ